MLLQAHGSCSIGAFFPDEIVSAIAAAVFLLPPRLIPGKGAIPMTSGEYFGAKEQASVGR